ncbi:KAT8 regulatory NSL complex subunit 1-like protein [Larimichthys crocea]|uniref:Uncharacterized protein n=1 Tax=Larimichthys crocea TaxID=215358 RepID=A0ACD3QHJ1_LARCR|nr:KAT8 regulatory NSL complex subunit 1-like protein [Larimichthys crocea]
MCKCFVLSVSSSLFYVDLETTRLGFYDCVQYLEIFATFTCKFQTAWGDLLVRSYKCFKVLDQKSIQCCNTSLHGCNCCSLSSVTPAPPASSSSSSSSSSCERRWLEERAELGSRWSWLQLRLAKLEGRIQQLVELHKHIRSTKSAQLSQIVNSLIPPLSFSPLSKQPQTWKGKRAFTSGQRGDDAFVPGKRRRLGTKRLFKADLSCVCARTRPLVTYHKPKLFTFSTNNPSSPRDSGNSMSTLSSSCSCCSSFDPVVLCSDPDCSSSQAVSSRTSSSPPHRVLPLHLTLHRPIA